MLKYYGLSQNPFTVTPSSRFFYLSNLHKEITFKTDYVVDYRQGLSVIYGDLGMGKSTLVRALYERYSDNPQNAVFAIPNPNYKSEFTWAKAICDEMGVGPKQSQYKQMTALKTKLSELYIENKNAILIVDEAQNLVGGQYEILREINNYETDEHKLLQVILCGQLELRRKLDLKRALLSRVITTSTLEALSPQETEEMIRFRLSVAGGDANLFRADAIIRIYEQTVGVPRDVIKLCGKSLKIAHSMNRKTITANVVDKAVAT